MSLTDSLKRAAYNILTRSLGLRQNHNLVIFADAVSIAAAELVAQTARELGIFTSIILVPRSLQFTDGATDGLPLPVEAAIREADAVLSALSDRPEHLSYRLKLLRTAWNRRTKLANAPGLTLDGLRKCDTDYAQISERCRLLALALILGRQMEVITADRGGREHRLLVPLRGWENPPGIGDGVVLDGTWGNLPPGEVYVVPRYAEGKVVVNGAVQDRLLPPGEELVLAFRAGKLAEVQPKDSPAARHFYGTQAAYGEAFGVCEWSHLAEIGFGVNPAVRELTGNASLDKRKAYTLHIAVARRADLGGDVEAMPHGNMIIGQAAVLLDGRMLLDTRPPAPGQGMGNGLGWRLSEADWRLDHRRVTVPIGWWHSLTDVCRSPLRAERDHDRLVCRWSSGRGRWDSAPVGVDPTARLAARLYDLLPEAGGRIPAQQLAGDAERVGLDRDIVPELLWVMYQYDVVQL